MNNPKDQAEKALQEWLESGAPDASAEGKHLYDKEDLSAYLTLFEALKEKPAAELPYNFSDNIVANIQARRDRVADFKWNFILPIAMILFTALTYIALLYINSDYADKMLQFFFTYKWHVVFVAVCFFIIQYFDTRLLKKMHHGSTTAELKLH